MVMVMVMEMELELEQELEQGLELELELELGLELELELGLELENCSEEDSWECSVQLFEEAQSPALQPILLAWKDPQQNPNSWPPRTSGKVHPLALSPS